MSQTPAPAGPMPQVPAPPRRKGRMRITILLLGFLILAGGSGYLYWKRIHDEKTADVIKSELEDSGVSVVYMSDADTEFSYSPLKYLSSPRIFQVITKKPVTDAQLEKIGRVALDLKLNLGDNGGLTDKGLAILDGKKNIRWLYVPRTSVSDEGIKHLKGMDLEELDLSRTKITDAGLETLSHMDLPHLKNLDLEATNITNAGLEHLEKFKTLQYLAISKTKATKEGVKRLKSQLPEVAIF
jgi:hypothetical protein